MIRFAMLRKETAERAAKVLYKPKTNADRIRSMTDEELAEWLGPLTECVRCYARDKDEDYDLRPCYTGELSCEQFWLKWLKKEVKE